MCQADTNMITMKWGFIQSMPLGNFSNPHKCVNVSSASLDSFPKDAGSANKKYFKWDKLDNFAKDRWVDVFQDDYLHHPEKGKPFGDANEVKLGETTDLSKHHSHG
jgi:hypothetical protein